MDKTSYEGLKKFDQLLEPLWLGRVNRYPIEVLNFFASIATIITLFIVAIKVQKPEVWYVIILLVYLGIAVAIIFVQHFMYSRKARYAEAIRIFHPIAHILRDSFYRLDQMDQNAFEAALEKILDALAAGFQRTTGTKIRACIKRLEVEGGIEALQAISIPMRKSDIIHADLFVCDNHSVWLKKTEAKYPDDKNRLARNSAFLSIFNGENNYYIENNIPLAYKRRRYENSSFARYGHGMPGKPNWVLPYRSTMIWPIRKLTDKSELARKDKLADHHDIFGFLCVDSESRYVWANRYDSEVGAAVADMLFAFMDTWFQRNIDTEK